jgi:hypothetical protein
MFCFIILATTSSYNCFIYKFPVMDLLEQSLSSLSLSSSIEVDGGNFSGVVFHTTNGGPGGGSGGTILLFVRT